MVENGPVINVDMHHVRAPRQCPHVSREQHVLHSSCALASVLIRVLLVSGSAWQCARRLFKAGVTNNPTVDEYIGQPRMLFSAGAQHAA